MKMLHKLLIVAIPATCVMHIRKSFLCFRYHVSGVFKIKV